MKARRKKEDEKNSKREEIEVETAKKKAEKTHLVLHT